MEKEKIETLDPKEVTLDQVRYHYEAVPIFKYLLHNGWGIKGFSKEDDRHTLCFITPEGESLSPNGALYCAVTGKNPSGKNVYHLMEKAGFDMRLFEKFQYLSSHRNHQSRLDFVRDVIDPIIEKYKTFA